MFANFIQNTISTPDHVTTVKFDSYPDNPATNYATHTRRYPLSSLFVDIQKGTLLDISKSEYYVSNYKNKQSFVQHLGKHLGVFGIKTQAAQYDADRDIVVFAVCKLQYTDVTIFGDDRDLVVLILHHA